MLRYQISYLDKCSFCVAFCRIRMLVLVRKQFLQFCCDHWFKDSRNSRYYGYRSVILLWCWKLGFRDRQIFARFHSIGTSIVARIMWKMWISGLASIFTYRFTNFFETPSTPNWFRPSKNPCVKILLLKNLSLWLEISSYQFIMNLFSNLNTRLFFNNEGFEG